MRVNGASAAIRRPKSPRVSVAALLLSGTCLWVSILTGYWLPLAGIIVLIAGWRFLPQLDGLPVLPLAFTYQWAQVMSGVLYLALTGRVIWEMSRIDYQPIVLIGLGCLVALTIGLRIGVRLPRTPSVRSLTFARIPLDSQVLAGAYLILTIGSGFLSQFAWSVSALTQGLLALNNLRLVLLFIVLRRFMSSKPRYAWVFSLMILELFIGFTGFFASFRESLILILMIAFEMFRSERLGHWIRLATLVGLVVGLGMLWLSIRQEYRRGFRDTEFAESRSARAERIGSLSSKVVQSGSETLWTRLDFGISRLWAVYYPALAVARVPSVLPHEGGAILWQSFVHIFTPRILFPEKERLRSDSSMVKKYSGVWVAGEEQDTSIAFGYAAESYVDFGLPWMFIPIFIFGLLMGIAYKWLLNLIIIRELGTALVAVLFWLSLFLFERSWIKMIGMSLTWMIYLGGAVWLIDRWLVRRTREKAYRTKRTVEMAMRGAADFRRPRPGAA